MTAPSNKQHQVLVPHPYLAGFEYIAQIHQASAHQAGFFSRRTPKRIWKEFKENNALLGHPYENKLPVLKNPTLDELEKLWNGWRAANTHLRGIAQMPPTDFLHLVDPWIRDFRLPQR